MRKMIAIFVSLLLLASMLDVSAVVRKKRLQCGGGWK